MSREFPKLSRTFTIEKETYDYLIEVQKNKGLPSQSATIDLIAKEHKLKADTTTEQMIKIIANHVSERLKDELKTIQNGVRFTDRNVQILLELLDALFLKQNHGDIITSNELKSPALLTAEEHINSKIIKQRTKRLKHE